MYFLVTSGKATVNVGKKELLVVGCLVVSREGGWVCFDFVVFFVSSTSNRVLSARWF